MSKIIRTDNLNSENSKLFFGDYSGFQRYDSPKYDELLKLEEKQRNAFWNPSEISMNNDRLKYETLPKHVQEIMVQIWLFQTLMDSGQNKGLDESLAPLATLPELEALCKTWAYFELIHSISYSHIIRGIFADTDKIFSSIVNYPAITNRIDREINLYSHLTEIDETDDSIENKKLVLEMLVSIFALEGIKFYSSFLLTYTINNLYNGAIQGATRIIKLINFDEDMHTLFTYRILNILESVEDEGFKTLMKSSWYYDMCHRVMETVYEDELEWATHLLSVGPINGLNKHQFELFLGWYRDLRLFQVDAGDEPLNKPSIVQWFEDYKDMNKDNAALQESDLAAYSVGIMKDDIDDDTFSF